MRLPSADSNSEPLPTAARSSTPTCWSASSISTAMPGTRSASSAAITSAGRSCPAPIDADRMTMRGGLRPA